MCATTTPCTPSRLRTPTSSTATPALIGASSSRASSPAWARPPSLAPPSSLPARTDMTSRLLPILFLSLLIGGTSVVQAQDAGTARLKDLVLLEGAAPIQITGYGLVVGLDRTGDRARGTRGAGYTVQSVPTCCGASASPLIRACSTRATRRL